MIKSGYITTSTDPTFLISKSFPSCHSYSPTHPLYTDTPTPPLTPQSNTWEAIFCHASLNKAVDLAYTGGLTRGVCVSGSYLGIKIVGQWGFPLITLLFPHSQCSHSNVLSTIFDTHIEKKINVQITAHKRYQMTFYH